MHWQKPQTLHRVILKEHYASYPDFLIGGKRMQRVQDGNHDHVRLHNYIV